MLGTYDAGSVVSGTNHPCWVPFRVTAMRELTFTERSPSARQCARLSTCVTSVIPAPMPRTVHGGPDHRRGDRGPAESNRLARVTQRTGFHLNFAQCESLCCETCLGTNPGLSGKVDVHTPGIVESGKCCVTWHRARAQRRPYELALVRKAKDGVFGGLSWEVMSQGKSRDLLASGCRKADVPVRGRMHRGGGATVESRSPWGWEAGSLYSTLEYF